EEFDHFARFRINPSDRRGSTQRTIKCLVARPLIFGGHLLVSLPALPFFQARVLVEKVGWSGHVGSSDMLRSWFPIPRKWPVGTQALVAERGILCSRLRREHAMDPPIIDAIERFNRYRSESIKIETEIWEMVRKTRDKITETRGLIANADRLLDDSRKVWGE